jgi:hypothetical protein
MARKVFFSWQSDREERAGRYFLRDALQRAINELHAEIDFEVANRPELDHDTKGVVGSPGIADVILSKIRESAVFVADVTLIGKADNGKPVINPNVAIELGYALKAVGDAGLVMVMNRAHGDREGLPFDLKYRRGPIYYKLGDGADGATRKAAQDGIVPALKEAIKLRLDSLPAGNEEDADRQSVVARIRKMHEHRVEKILAGVAPVAVLGGGMLVMHVVPLSAVDERPAPAFDEISRNPNRFFPIGDNHARDARVDYVGLLTGSNTDGLSKPQRAYTQVLQSGTVEAVVSSLERTKEHFIELPHLQAIVIKYARLYANSLSSSGVGPPFVILVSLAGVKGKRLLHDFIGNWIPEDVPYRDLSLDRYQFNEAIFESVPRNAVESGRMLKPLLLHLARASGLAGRPYFDDDGNFTLAD